MKILTEAPIKWDEDVYVAFRMIWWWYLGERPEMRHRFDNHTAQVRAGVDEKDEISVRNREWVMKRHLRVETYGSMFSNILGKLNKVKKHI